MGHARWARALLNHERWITAETYLRRLVWHWRSSLALAPLLVAACAAADKPAQMPAQPAKALPTIISGIDPESRLHNTQEPWRLPTNAEPLSYAIKLDLEPDKETFQGSVEIEVQLAKLSPGVVLNARGLDIHEAVWRQGADYKPAKTHLRQGFEKRGPADELVVRFNQVVSGRVNVRLRYTGKYRDDLRGLYRVHRGAEDYVFSQMEPMDARSVFPCFDEPKFKTPFEVQVSVPEGQLAFSNMPEVERVPNQGRVNFHFQKSPPMPTYLIGIATGKLDVRAWQGAKEQKPSIPVRLIAPHGSSQRGTLALEAVAPLLARLEQYFGMLYPYPKLDLVAVPEFGAGAMENVGLVTFREELLLVTDASPEKAKIAMAGVTTHELAHMWFGDLVTMPWWNEIWLNESFATWMANKITSAWHPDYELRQNFLGWQSYTMGQDSLPTMRAIRQPVRTQTDTMRAFGGVTYAKGAAVLNMVEQWLGQERFRQGIQNYLRAHAWGSATSQDLFQALSIGGEPVAAVFDSFTSQAGVPQVQVTHTCEGGKLDVHFSQQAFVPLGGTKVPPKRWQIPACIRFPGSGKVEEHCALLSQKQQTLEVPVDSCPSWLVPNASQSAYYYAQLNAEDRKALGAAFAQLDPRERVGLMMNFSAMLSTGSMLADEYLRLVEPPLRGQLAANQVWEQFLWSARYFRTWLLTPKERPAFERWLRGVLEPTLTRVGAKTLSTDSPGLRMLRRTVRQGAAEIAQSPVVIKQAKAVVSRWLVEPAQVPGDEAAAALPIAARHADKPLVEALQKLVNTSKVAEYRTQALRALGAVEQPEIVKALLADLAAQKYPFADARHILGGLLQNADIQNLVYPWFRDNFDQLSHNLPVFVMRNFVSSAINRCSLDDRDEIQAFFKPRLAKLEGMDDVLEESLENARRCQAYKEKQGPVLRAFLNEK